MTVDDLKKLVSEAAGEIANRLNELSNQAHSLGVELESVDVELCRVRKLDNDNMPTVVSKVNIKLVLTR